MALICTKTTTFVKGGNIKWNYEIMHANFEQNKKIYRLKSYQAKNRMMFKTITQQS